VIDYTAPEFINFETPELRALQFNLEQDSFPLQDSGKAKSPEWLSRKTVAIAGNKYTVGLGGLHSKNKSESYYTDDKYFIIDLDVTSYYPAIVLNCGYQPPHMGDVFTRIYQGLVDQRLKAKKEGDKVAAEVLKITINGTFGKTGSKYSAIYAPHLLLSITFTGQLALLMLIEKMANKDIKCVSANTDGVTLKVAREQLLDMGVIVQGWEESTGFKMEATRYRSIHFRDVNNYFALTVDEELKTKGIFKAPDIAKNPTCTVVINAVMDYILKQIPIEHTIESCGTIQDFLSVRTVRGGAAKDGEYLGKAVRWYYSTDTNTAIHYISNGNKVAKTDGAMPMMDLLPGLPHRS
jgi:hypothetical protein